MSKMQYSMASPNYRYRPWSAERRERQMRYWSPARCEKSKRDYYVVPDDCTVEEIILLEEILAEKHTKWRDRKKQPQRK